MGEVQKGLGASQGSGATGSALKINHTDVGDFDGDGIVVRACVITGAYHPGPTVRITVDSGNHQTHVDLNPADLGNFCHLLERARKAAMKALVAQ